MGATYTGGDFPFLALEKMDNSIRIIHADEVEKAVESLFFEAARFIPSDVAEAISEACKNEQSSLSRQVLARISDNNRIAAEKGLPICQDCGMAVVFAEIGDRVHISGDTLENAINRGVKRAYLNGDLRCSVVKDPLFDRKNTADNTPAILHVRFVSGDRLKLVVAPKGFGSENMSFLKMMTPAATPEDVVRFVVQSVSSAGSNPCPPIVVGVGIGSDFEGVALLAKKALLRPLNEAHHDPRYAALESKILDEINRLGIGPQGFGGITTALAVHILDAPTHIAGLPVAVNISCHVLRHKEMIL